MVANKFKESNFLANYSANEEMQHAPQEAHDFFFCKGRVEGRPGDVMFFILGY
jgi:hypothetical protein